MGFIHDNDFFLLFHLLITPFPSARLCLNCIIILEYAVLVTSDGNIYQCLVTKDNTVTVLSLLVTNEAFNAIFPVYIFVILLNDIGVWKIYFLFDG